jgi:uncharacterized membrane protein (TIGR02234 family)
VRTRRELAAATLLGVAGAGLVAGLAGRTWVTVTERAAGLQTVSQHLTGRSLSGVIAALGWAGLAGIAALLATRGWPRVAVGVLLTVFGVVIAVVSPTAVRRAHALSVAGRQSNLARLTGNVTVHPNAWWVISLAGGVLLAAAGLLTVARGRRWPGMSTRYDRPGAAPPPRNDDPASLWKALDRGDDPTSSDLKER